MFGKRKSLRGLYNKFSVYKNKEDGTKEELTEKVFVLTPEKDYASLKALEAYANTIEKDNQILFNSIKNWINRIKYESYVISSDEIKILGRDNRFAIFLMENYGYTHLINSESDVLLFMNIIDIYEHLKFKHNDNKIIEIEIFDIKDERDYKARNPSDIKHSNRIFKEKMSKYSFRLQIEHFFKKYFD